MPKSVGTNRDPQNIAAGVLFAGIGGAGLWGSFSYPIGTAVAMGPGYFPAMVFGALAFVGLVVLSKGIIAAGPPLESWAWRPLLVILASLVVFAYAVERLGFVVASAGLILIATSVATGLTIAQRVLLAATLTFFCWVVFILGLGLLIPTWPELA